MHKCTRAGCGKEYTDNLPGSCSYHPGAPVFHEGLKSWSCCPEINKPVLDFESFMAMPGCETGSHTEEKQVQPTLKSPTASASASNNANLKMSTTTDGKEVYSSGPSTAQIKPESNYVAPSVAPAVVLEEEDDLSAPVPPGTKCRRKGCDQEFVSDEENRLGDGPGTKCIYHPAPPLFREGSKGYLCCKRRVLEFEEFLKIQGCKTGRHVFIKKAEGVQSSDSPKEELVTCRIDHYQTPSEVRVSVFAKQADKSRSTVEFQDNKVHVDLFLPGAKRFTRTIKLYGPIDPAASSFTFFGTKLELLLVKQDGRSWNLLERSDIDVGNYNLTFGVGGRTGTVGAKQQVPNNAVLE